MTGFKGLVFYTIPKADVQVAATFRSTPGVANTFGNGAGGAQPSGLAANFAATNAYLAANSNLGRVLSGRAANTPRCRSSIRTPCIWIATTSLISVIGKVFRLSGTRTTVNLDMYNLLNRSTILHRKPDVRAHQQPLADADGDHAIRDCSRSASRSISGRH